MNTGEFCAVKKMINMVVDSNLELQRRCKLIERRVRKLEIRELLAVARASKRNKNFLRGPS